VADLDLRISARRLLPLEVANNWLLRQEPRSASTLLTFALVVAGELRGSFLEPFQALRWSPSAEDERLVRILPSVISEVT